MTQTGSSSVLSMLHGRAAMRPDGTEGWDAERLQPLVTRDSMIGTGLPRSPA